jgi:V-type H+-transporting ATPase subunit D
MKIKLKGAQTGHSLLKRKSDALSARFRAILTQIRTAKYEMGELIKSSALSMAQVNYAAGDISFAVRESVNGPAQFQVQTRIENVSGIQLPIFEAFFASSSTANTGAAANSPNSNVSTSSGAPELTALSRGGQQVQKCRETNIRVLQSLLRLASLQTAFHILEDVIKITNRRVNALEYVILPKTENTIGYISSELDEQDREEFFRLKKVQAKKKEREEIKEREQQQQEEEEQDIKCEDPFSSNTRPISLLEIDHDPDIIF